MQTMAPKHQIKNIYKYMNSVGAGVLRENWVNKQMIWGIRSLAMCDQSHSACLCRPSNLIGDQENPYIDWYYTKLLEVSTPLKAMVG